MLLLAILAETEAIATLESLPRRSCTDIAVPLKTLCVAALSNGKALFHQRN